MKTSFLNSYFFFLWIFPALLFSNNTPEYLESDMQPVEIDRTNWETATKDLNYEPTEEALARKAKKQNWDIDGEFWAIFFKGLMLIGIIALTLLFLRFLVGVQGIKTPSNRTFDPNQEIDTETIAEQIHEYDLSTLVRQALDSQDYTLATRLYYLWGIQALSEKKHIKWKKDKTNKSYLKEIQDLNFKRQFRDLTNIFERIWYGQSVIDQAAFSQIQSKFQQFIHSLNVTIQKTDRYR